MEVYEIGGAAASGALARFIRQQVGSETDMMAAAGGGVVAYLGAGATRGLTSDVATGALHGFASYLGSRLVETGAGNNNDTGRAVRTRTVRRTSKNSGGSASTIEI